MKKSMNLFGLVLVLFSINSIAATLSSMSKTQFEKAIVNKTLISIATDNLNGQTINNTFSMFLDNQGHIFGKMLTKPAGEPRTDAGLLTIDEDGTFRITWQHWDEAKPVCGHLFETKNAYISVDCNNVFHTVFMKEDIKSGNHL